MRELTDYEIELFDRTGQIPDTKVPFGHKERPQVKFEQR